jgi:hypothetical protein
MGPQAEHGLAAADVALQQAPHRLAAREVGAQVGHDRALARGQLEREARADLGRERLVDDGRERVAALLACTVARAPSPAKPRC